MTKSAQRSQFVGLGICFSLTVFSAAALAQPGQGGGFGIDPRAESRTYVFEGTGEELPYCVYKSSKVTPDKPAPLIIALHGMGATPDIMCNSTTIDLAEEGGYILAAPMGYTTMGWYGSPVISFGAPPGRGAPGAAPGGRGPRATPGSAAR